VFDRILLVAAIELIAVAVAHSGVIACLGNAVTKTQNNYVTTTNEEFNDSLIEQVKLERQLELGKTNVSIR
jgi:hypothetical protein